MKKKLFILTFCILTILVLILTSCDKNSEQITSNDTSNTTSKIENKTYNIKQNNPEIIHYLKLNNNDPEWGTNYENEKYKDFVFANLPRSYEGDDFPEYMMHKEDEAYNNPCLHISVPDTYELSGKWDGQIFINLGKDSITDPNKKLI